MSHFFLSIYLEKWKFSSNWLARSLAQSTFLFCKQDFCSTSCHLNLLLVFHSKVRHFPTLILSTLKYYICWWNILEKSFFIINYLILKKNKPKKRKRSSRLGRGSLKTEIRFFMWHIKCVILEDSSGIKTQLSVWIIAQVPPWDAIGYWKSCPNWQACSFEPQGLPGYIFLSIVPEASAINWCCKSIEFH